MDRLTLQAALREWDKKGVYLFSKHDFAKLFWEDEPKALTVGIHRHVKAGILQPICRSLYVNPYAHSLDGFVLERIALKMRAGHYNVLSLESALSEHGVISQIPVDRLTIMTTGRSGVYHTPFGTVELTHTKRSVQDILQNSYKMDGRPLRIASKEAALRDLKRVGRNLTLIQQEEMRDGR